MGRRTFEWAAAGGVLLVACALWRRACWRIAVLLAVAGVQVSRPGLRLRVRARDEVTTHNLVLGLKQVGSRDDAPYDRMTGAGFVAACDGQYADALSKGVGVSLLVAESETTAHRGALAASFMTSILRLLARQTRLPGATDNTRYGEGRASPRSFLTHHVAHISTAIQAADAQTILNAASARMLRVSFGVM